MVDSVLWESCVLAVGMALRIEALLKSIYTMHPIGQVLALLRTFWQLLVYIEDILHMRRLKAGFRRRMPTRYIARLLGNYPDVSSWAKAYITCGWPIWSICRPYRRKMQVVGISWRPLTSSRGKPLPKPLERKKPDEVITAFALILWEAGAKPKFLHTDRDTEFTNRKFRNWLDEENIIHYHTFNNEIKCSLVERWHRTLKNHMFRYFTYKNTLHYLKVLPQLVSAYNSRKHRSLGVAPADVTRKNEKVLWERQYGSYLRQRRKRYRYQINVTGLI